MTDLSPQAQAVLDAFNERHELCGPFDGNWQELCLSAALRAAAKQVVPTTIDPRLSTVRSDLMRIAAELKGEAALAQPEPQGLTAPTRRQILMLADELGISDLGGSVRLVQEALRLWGRPAVEPVPHQEAGQ